MSGFKVVVMDFGCWNVFLSRAKNTVCYIIKCLHIHSDHFSAQMAPMHLKHITPGNKGNNPPVTGEIWSIFFFKCYFKRKKCCSKINVVKCIKFTISCSWWGQPTQSLSTLSSCEGADTAFREKSSCESGRANRIQPIKLNKWQEILIVILLTNVDLNFTFIQSASFFWIGNDTENKNLSFYL